MSKTIYAWEQAPDNLKTRKQLAEMGLRPGGPEVARVEWGRGRWVKYALLYDVAQAQPKKPATPAQLAALEKARLKRECCPHCGYALGFVPWKRFSWRDCPACVQRHIQRAHDDAVATALEVLDSPQAVILDTETTGLDQAYAVQLAVIGMDGTVLFDSLLNPQAEITEGAQQVHGITAEMVADAPTFREIEDDLSAALSGCQVWAYNMLFDWGVFCRELWRAHPGDECAEAGKRFPGGNAWHCAMTLYAEWYGEWDARYGFRWQKLPGGDHSALGDCRATLRALRNVAEDRRIEEGFRRNFQV